MARPLKSRAWIAPAVLILAGVARAEIKATTTRPVADVPHVVAAEQLIATLDAEHNHYSYTDNRLTWAGVDGAKISEANVDCSSFLSLLLGHVYHRTPEQIAQWLGKKRPVAANYYDAIVAGKGFVRVAEVADVRRGDVVAMKYPPGEKDTGHCVIVAAVPRSRDATEPVVPGTRQWEVDVLDATKSGHGPTDSRRKPDKTFTGGVGRGTIRLYTDDAGRFVGYSWSTFGTSEYRKMDDRAVAVGRLKPDFAK